MFGRLREAISRLFSLQGPAAPAPSLFPLADLLETELSRQLDPWPHLADLVVDKLREQGIRVSRRDRRRIEQAMRRERWEDSIQLGSWKWWDTRSVTVSITENDVQTIIDKLDRPLDSLGEIVETLTESTAPGLRETFRKFYRSEIRADQRAFRRLEQSIAERWDEPFESLHLLIELGLRMGMTLSEHFAQERPTEQRLAEVLMRLYARGIHVAREISVLLRAGYPDAAMARWRTLHEIAVVSAVVGEYGEECADAYLQHNAVATFKAAKQYQGSAEQLGFESLSAEQFDELKAGYDQAVARQGKQFREDYGWAARALSKEKPTFADLEAAVGLDHLRPFYGWASQNVHAGPRGLLVKLGTVHEDVLLVGPSPYGLADPGQNTALSLAVLVANLMRLHSVMDTLMTSKVAVLLAREAADRFVTTQRRLEARTNFGG
jgi:uncharacterized protein DUF5677